MPRIHGVMSSKSMSDRILEDGKNSDNGVYFVETWTTKYITISEWPSEQKIAQCAVIQTGIIEMNY